MDDLKLHIKEAMNSIVDIMADTCLGEDLSGILPIVISTAWETDPNDGKAIIHMMPVSQLAVTFSERASADTGASILSNMAGFMGKLMALSGDVGLEFMAICIVIRSVDVVIEDVAEDSGPAILAVGASKDGEFESIRIQPIKVDGDIATALSGNAVKTDATSKSPAKDGDQSSLYDLVKPFFIANANDDPTDFSWTHGGGIVIGEAATVYMRQMMDRMQKVKESRSNLKRFPLKGRYAMITRSSDAH